MAKRKKAAKKAVKRQRAAKPKAPRKVVITASKQTTIGKVRKAPKGAGYYLKAAKDRLYDQLAGEMIRKEKATKKAAKKKIGKKITLIRQQINRIK